MISAEEASREEFSDLGNYTKHIRFARVTQVFDATTLAESDKYGCVNLVWEDTTDQVNGAVSFLKSGYSSIFGYGVVVMPSIGDIAACYTLPAAPPIILGFFSRDQFQAIRASKDNTDSIAHMRPLTAGEILIKGRSQSEIYMKRDGQIKITVKDGTATNTVYNKNNQFTTEKFLEKTGNTNKNTVLELELGKTDKLAGPGKQIFSLSSGDYVEQAFEFMASPGVLQYNLNPITKTEIHGIESVKLYAIGTDGKEVLKKTLGPTSNVGLIKSYYYTQGVTATNDISQKSCTMDTNGTFTAISLPPNVTGLLTKDTKIVVTLWVTRSGFSFRVNELGDAIMDCRNFIVRTKENKSFLGLFEDSRAILGAVETEVGDKLTGFIKTDRGGVHTSSGIFENASLEKIDKATIKSAIGDCYYFYIADEFPLIAYTPDDAGDQFHIVPVSEYMSLSLMQRNSITCRPFDANDALDGFTRNKFDALLTKLEANGIGWMAYGVLRSI